MWKHLGFFLMCQKVSCLIMIFTCYFIKRVKLSVTPIIIPEFFVGRVIGMVFESAAVEAKHVRHKPNTSKIFTIPLNVCSSTKCIRMVFPGVHWTKHCLVEQQKWEWLVQSISQNMYLNTPGCVCPSQGFLYHSRHSWSLCYNLSLPLPDYSWLPGNAGVKAHLSW